MMKRQLAVYLGKDLQSFLPGLKTTQFLRGVPRAIDEKSETSRAIMRRLFPDYQIINDEKYYIGSTNTLESFEPFEKALKTGGRVLILRDIGLGDIILSMPTVRKIRERLPNVEITYATLPAYVELFEGHDYVDRVVDFRSCDMASGKYDLIINWIRGLEYYSIERNKGRRVESYAKTIGLGLSDTEQVIAPVIQQGNENAADAILNAYKGPYIVYILKAAAWNRTYPIWKANGVFDALRKRFPQHTILILDNQQDFGLFTGIPGVVNLAGKTKTIMDAAAVMNRADLVISPDTGMAHLAASLGINTVVLLSSMPFEWRYDHYGPHIRGIHKIGAAPCIPCWDWHRDRGKIRYCHRDRINHCMMNIMPDDIANMVEAMIGG